MAEGVAALSARNPHYAETIAAWKDRWGEMFSGVIGETTSAIERVDRRGVSMFGLSNAPAEIMPAVLAMHPALGRLRDIAVSGAEKIAKPDPAIFALACRRADLTPGELLFVNDVAANIAASRALGFRVHLFDDPAALLPALERCGLF